MSEKARLRCLVFSTSTNNTHTFANSLNGIADVSVFRYDSKWYEKARQMVAQNPQLAQNFPAHLITRQQCEMDKEMLIEAKISEPDLIIYVSAWQGAFVPLNETLGELNQIAPMVHLLNDGADHPWWPQLKEFERRGTFSLTVNIDGSHYWPGGRDWPWQGFEEAEGPKFDHPKPIKNAMTLLTPVDVSCFPRQTPFKFEERPYAIGYAGNRSGPFRDAIVTRLQGVRGFAFRERDHQPNSYPAFADFLKLTRVSVSVPFTGSGQRRHVKGRVLESGFAGACLLEWKNDATIAWFEPRRDYWEYESIEQCAELAEWLAHHPKIAEETGRALQDRLWKEHAPEVFWKQIFERLGK